MTRTLKQIVENGLCHGCGACASVTPSLAMEMKPSGYLRPEADENSHVGEDAIEAVCSGIALDHQNLEADYHPLWGPIRRLATGHATDPETRHRGSSGGVLSALQLFLVEQGEVDYVLSTSADPQDPIGTATSMRSDRQAILGAAGSRYAPSSPLANLGEHLAKGRPFAFVGKPCDVAALRRMASHDPRIDRLIPYKLAFFCAGVPSRKGTIDVLSALETREEDVDRFQYRGDGWPGLARVVRKDGSDASMTYNDSWGKILNRHLQFRCKICPDGTGEFSDIACADAWYGKDGYPDFTERDGRSLIVARTEAGERLLALAQKAGVLAAQPLAVEEIEAMQPYQANRKRNALARSSALWAKRGNGPRFSGLKLPALTLRTSPIELARNFWGTFKRIKGPLG